MDDLNGDVHLLVTLLMVLPLLSLTLFLAQAYRLGIERNQHLWPIYLALAVGAIAYVLWRLLRASQRMDTLRAGYDAETAAGQELDQLMRQGAATFHDLPAEKFNIDHVVISTHGVFAVETKGFTKRRTGDNRGDATVFFNGTHLKFPAWTTKEPIEQAQRQASWLAMWLKSAVGKTVPVFPVLALPGWFVQRTGNGSVQVFSGRELGKMLSTAEQRLSAEDMQRIIHQIEQRCRTVLPHYRDEDNPS